jgi:PhzF family phenazine biosynthesis protein
MAPDHDGRDARGRAVAAELFGGYRTPHLAVAGRVAPDLERYAFEFVFGEVYAGAGLALRDRQLVTLGALTALGAVDQQLAAHFHAALNVGLTRSELVQAVIQTAPFAGFPRALNSIAILDSVLAATAAAPSDARTGRPMKIYTIDAFADEPFRGNPAAVCIVDSLHDDAWMQAVAGEMNLSETAFVAPGPDGTFAIRWFTPRTEVTQCGHATIAAAHLIWARSLLPAGAEIRFTSASGPLVATREDSVIWLDFPAEPAEAVADPPADLLAALLGPDEKPVWVGRNRFDYVIEVADEETVRRLRPDPGPLSDLPRGVTVTAPAADTDGDFVCRFFAPAVGVLEDPVTGSAQCALGPYWRDRLGRTDLRCRQLSARGGDVRVRVRGDRVHFGGPAVTVLDGALVCAA